MKTREIIFQYAPAVGRSQADCGDLYNWLLDQNEKVAQSFYRKWHEAEDEIKKKIKYEKNRKTFTSS